MTYLQTGTPAMEISIAVDESYKGKDGQKAEKCEWVRVKAFDKQADFCERWLRKGKLVYVQGKLATRTWEKDGQKHYQTEILVNAPGMGVQPLEWPDKDEQGRQDQQLARGNQNSRRQTQDEELGPAFPTEASGMDDVPF
jgi:single-strand DNA-binding protein